MDMSGTDNPGARLQQPIDEEVAGVDIDVMEHDFTNRSCCFFRAPEFHCWQRMSEADEGWAVIAWKKMREWSELAAGPRWKNFIRRFGRNRAAGGQGRFGYDPLSYARNFDDGPNGQYSDDDAGFRPDFSSRFAAIPVSAKSSMDLGRDGPSFT